MTTHKDFKRLVRTRMQKTGESYTSALSKLRLVGKSGRGDVGKESRAEQLPHIPTSPPPDFAKLAGMSDAAIKKGSGCAWDKWVYVLDKVEAHTWPHRRLAEYVHEKYKVPGWWTQSVAVGYERIKGLRDIGQRRGGGYEASRSKTVAVSRARAFEAWSNARTRARWLPGVKLKIRTAQPGKSLRITWPDETHLDVWITSKGTAKTSLAVTHTKLTDKADAEARKLFWGERLEALARLLAPAAKKKKTA